MTKRTETKVSSKPQPTDCVHTPWETVQGISLVHPCIRNGKDHLIIKDDKITQEIVSKLNEYERLKQKADMFDETLAVVSGLLELALDTHEMYLDNTGTFNSHIRHNVNEALKEIAKSKQLTKESE